VRTIGSEQILKQHNALATFQHHFYVVARNRPAPPFVIDAPRFEDRFDFSDCPAVRPSDRHQTGFIQFHRNRAWFVYGS